MTKQSMKYEVDGMEIELKEVEEGLYDVFIDGKLDGKFENIYDMYWVLTSDRFCIDTEINDEVKFEDTIENVLMEYMDAKLEEETSYADN